MTTMTTMTKNSVSLQIGHGGHSGHSDLKLGFIIISQPNSLIGRGALKPLPWPPLPKAGDGGAEVAAKFGLCPALFTPGLAPCLPCVIEVTDKHPGTSIQGASLPHKGRNG